MDDYCFQAEGQSFRMRAGGVMARHYEQSRFYEGHMLAYIRELGLAGRYLDVGANIGNHSVFFDKLCRSNAVDAFEPGKEAFRLLQWNVQSNNCDRTACHMVGLSDSEGRGTNVVGRQKIEFQARTLDSYAFQDVTLIKLDIEGMETEFLRGAHETLRRSRIVLFIEAQLQSDLAAQEEVLSPLGYVRSGRKWNATPTYEWRSDRSSA